MDTMVRTKTGAAGLIVLMLTNLADFVGMDLVGTPGNPPSLIIPSFVLAVIGTVATVGVARPPGRGANRVRHAGGLHGARGPLLPRRQPTGLNPHRANDRHRHQPLRARPRRGVVAAGRHPRARTDCLRTPPCLSFRQEHLVRDTSRATCTASSLSRRRRPDPGPARRPGPAR
jgi:hypothetical protein